MYFHFKYHTTFYGIQTPFETNGFEIVNISRKMWLQDSFPYKGYVSTDLFLSLF